ncbi:MAG: extracellular solute-binding protein [Casimicrobiaceae bacterium]
MRTFVVTVSTLLALSLPIPGASAASAPDAVAVGAYDAPDRQQRLVEGAKAEGELTLYTSLTVEDMAVLNAAFEKKYGIKVKMWRAAADKVVQRAVTEARGGRFDVDVIELSAPSLESLAREKLLVPVRSPYQAELLAAAVPAHREWVGSRLNVFAQAYNTRLVNKADLPKTYADLLDPKWKGKLGIEAGDDDWFAEVVRSLGETQGLELFRKLAAGNGLSVRKGHTLLTNMVASGEVPLALTVYNFTAEQVKQKGAPLDWFVLAPAVARANGVAVARRAPHPHAAVLYYDFMIGEEGQRILADRGFVPTSRKIDTPLNRMPLRLVDPALVLDESAKWTRLYDEIIVRQAR